MAKKKNRKKHNFKYAGTQPPQLGTPANHPLVATTQLPRTETAKIVPGLGNFSYVRTDLTKVAALAVSFTAFELVLWLAFNHTRLGTTVYSWFRL